MTPTTVDALLGGRLSLEQPARGFRASIDAVLLASAVDAPLGGRVLDAGCGTGPAALCLAWRRPDLEICGLERDPATAALAERNVERNVRTATIVIVEGDLLAPPEALKRPFDAVMTNPPFNAPGGRPATDPGRAVAMLDALGPAAWLAACLRRLGPSGRLVVVHRADRLPAILAALDEVAGAIEIIPLWPTPDSDAAKRVIVRCRKGARSPAILRRGLVLHARTGIFSEAVEAILRHGAALDDVLPAG